MNYEEFPEIKKDYVPICLDMGIKPTNIVEIPIKIETQPVEVIKKVIEYKTIYTPYIIEREVFIETPKKNKPRKKYDLLTYPDHWSDKLRAKYKSYYFRCRQKGKNFSLSFEEFENLFNLPCRFCGSKESITIDRIDSNIGYELFNCQPCCNSCNTMKHFVTEYQFLEKIAQIYHYQLDNY